MTEHREALWLLARSGEDRCPLGVRGGHGVSGECYLFLPEV